LTQSVHFQTIPFDVTHREGTTLLQGNVLLWRSASRSNGPAKCAKESHVPDLCLEQARKQVTTHKHNFSVLPVFDPSLGKIPDSCSEVEHSALFACTKSLSSGSPRARSLSLSLSHSHVRASPVKPMFAPRGNRVPSWSRSAARSTLRERSFCLQSIESQKLGWIGRNLTGKFGLGEIKTRMLCNP
jgi:hypothetical protein